MVYRVLSKQTVIISGKSRAPISVNLKNGEHLPHLGLVEHVTRLMDPGIIMTRAVIEPYKHDIRVHMTICMDEPVTIYTNEQIGICECYYDKEAPHIGTCQFIHLGSVMGSFYPKLYLVICKIYLVRALFTYHHMIKKNYNNSLSYQVSRCMCKVKR